MDKEIRIINKSLVHLPKRTQRELGIESIQHHDNVFYSGNNVYKKIYIFKPAILANKKFDFIKVLLDTFNNRFRFSSFISNKDEKMNIYVFLTVFFEGSDYYSVQQEIFDFDAKFTGKLASIFNIKIEACSLESVLTYVHFNCTGNLKEIDTDLLFSQSGVKAIYSDIEQYEDNIYKSKSSDNRYISTYGASIYSYDNLNEFIEFISRYEGIYQYCIDIKKFYDEETELYLKELNKRYCLNNKRENINLVNIGMLINIVADTVDDLKKLNDNFLAFCNRNAIFLSSNKGSANIRYVSCASIGLKEFSEAYIISQDVIGNLLI